MKIFTCEQNTPEWLEARQGIITASSMSDVLAKGQGKTRAAYMHKLIAEIMTGQPTESYNNVHMDRGHEQEPMARDIYSQRVEVEIQRVGFVRNFDYIGGVGCSPDCLVGDDGAAEIKTRLPHLQVELLLSGKMPSAHTAQVQCILWVTGRKWVDFVSYCPSMPLFVQRVERDEAYIKEMRAEVEAFYKEMQSKINHIKTIGAQ